MWWGSGRHSSVSIQDSGTAVSPYKTQAQLCHACSAWLNLQSLMWREGEGERETVYMCSLRPPPALSLPPGCADCTAERTWHSILEVFMFMFQGICCNNASLIPL